MTRVFDDEADTISVDAGSDTMQVVMSSLVVEPSPADTIPSEVIDFDDTLVRRISACKDDDADDVILTSRPTTDSDWPPAPKPPGHRRFRRAGVYKAITKVSAIIKLK